MAAERGFADADRLAGVVKAAFGAGRRAMAADRLPNGSKKGVYRLTLDDGGTAVVYVWNAAEDYWTGTLPDGADDRADPFAHASGLDLFRAAVERLSGVGVACPRLIWADTSGELYPGDVAVVEDVSGGTLESLLERDAAAAAPVMARLAESLNAMHGYQASDFGGVAFVDGGGRSREGSCEQAVLDRALAETAEIAGRDQRAAARREELADKLRTLAGRVRPRAAFSVVHGELGPDHVLVDRRGAPVLIDIEGLMYFDVEWEHVFVRLRFGRHYEPLRRDGLDEDRLRLYQLAMHVDLVAGPLRIADGDHPERAWFLEIAEYHLERALAYRV